MSAPADLSVNLFVSVSASLSLCLSLSLSVSLSLSLAYASIGRIRFGVLVIPGQGDSLDPKALSEFACRFHREDPTE